MRHNMETLFLYSSVAFVGLLLAVAVSVSVYQKRLWQERLQLVQAQVAHRHEIAVEVLRTQENERQRIARELHDGTGGNLATAQLLLRHQHALLHQQGVEAPHLAEVEHALENSIDSIRQAAYDLAPPALERSGLTTALHDWSAHCQANGKLRVETTLPDPATRLPLFEERLTYRIVQELTTNVLKHAQANCITLLLDIQPEHVQLTFTDDGLGFNPKQQDNGMGLKNLQNRVSLLHGSLELVTAPGKGTQLTITWKTPVQHTTYVTHTSSKDPDLPR